MDAPCIQDAVEAMDEVERAFVHVVGFHLLYKSLVSVVVVVSSVDPRRTSAFLLKKAFHFD